MRGFENKLSEGRGVEELQILDLFDYLAEPVAERAPVAAGSVKRVHWPHGLRYPYLPWVWREGRLKLNISIEFP